MKTCVVCTSPKRALVEALWANGGRSKTEIAREAGIDRQSVNRHLLRHVGVRPVLPGMPTPAPGTSIPAPVPAPPSMPSSIPAMSPLAAFPLAVGSDPMPWQREFLAETRNTVIRKGRQIGASTCVSVIAACVMRAEAGTSVVIVSPGIRQSTIIAEKTRSALLSLGERLDRDATNLIQLDNGSRVMSLPGSRKSVRGWTADLLVMDEAAYIEGATITAARALVATGGRLVVLSTPALPDGYFYRVATAPPDGWASFVVRSEECSTISAEFLAAERLAMSAPEYAREYEAEFAADEDIAAIGLWTEQDWRALVREEE